MGQKNSLFCYREKPIAIQFRLFSHRPRRIALPIQSLNSTFQYAKSKKCRQVSGPFREICTFKKVRNLGLFGLRISFMEASGGLRFPLRVLHGIQEQTTFSHVVVPP
jgi:hypothetical protein